MGRDDLRVAAYVCMYVRARQYVCNPASAYHRGFLRDNCLPGEPERRRLKLKTDKPFPLDSHSIAVVLAGSG